MLLKGSQVLIECLIEQDVEVIFGYPGGKVIPIYDAIYEYRDKIKHILSAHEQGASHAADGYARATGKVGVCLATSGPGATNLITGIANAYMDSIPMVFITGNVPNKLIGTDAFQEVDITGVTIPVTKYNWIVKDPKDLIPIMRKAFELAQEGRPGPVLVDVPQDIQAALIEFEPLKKQEKVQESIEIRANNWSKKHSKALNEALELIRNAKRPFLLVGGGAVIDNDQELLIEFAEKVKAPVASSLMGHGAFPSSHRQYIGNIGMHGFSRNNVAAFDSDLFICVGSRFSDRLSDGFADDCKVLHIDIDRAEISKNVPADKYLIGSTSVIIKALNMKLDSLDKNSEFLESVLNKAAEKTPRSTKFDFKTMFEFIHDKIGDNGIVTTDVGQHQMWTAKYYPFEKPHTFITSGGLGTMGFGMGAAVGAKVGQPDTPVVLITGDGCLRMNLTELAMVSAYNVPIVIILFNNGTLGMVRQWQTLMFNKHYSETTLDRAPDFIMAAKAYGIDGCTINNVDEFKIAFENAIKSNKPAFIECMIDIDEMVLPMVKPGASMVDFFEE